VSLHGTCPILTCLNPLGDQKARAKIYVLRNWYHLSLSVASCFIKMQDSDARARILLLADAKWAELACRSLHSFTQPTNMLSRALWVCREDDISRDVPIVSGSDRSQVLCGYSIQSADVVKTTRREMSPLSWSDKKIRLNK